MNRRLTLRTLGAASALVALTAITGCAGLRTVSTEVSSFGDWPSGKAAGTYAFERLPSQQARAAEADALEAQARAALAKAGFKPVASGQEPEVLVQVGARDARAERDPWDDPLWWRGGFGGFGYGPWGSPRWGIYARGPNPRFERMVVVLIRERQSGKPVFEARATSEGNTMSDGPLLAAMFEAALTDFPKLGVNPRRVDVVVGAQP